MRRLRVQTKHRTQAPSDEGGCFYKRAPAKRELCGEEAEQRSDTEKADNQILNICF